VNVRAVFYLVLVSLMAPSVATAVCFAKCAHVEHRQALVAPAASCHDASPGDGTPDLVITGGEACHDEAGRVDARLAERLAVPAPALTPVGRRLSDGTEGPDTGIRRLKPQRIFLFTTQLRI
jgi:hypothetical protein